MESEHENTGPVKCEFCEKEFKSRDTLNCHKNARNKTPQICRKIDLDFKFASRTCQLCSKIFKYPSTLKIHKEIVHDKILPFKCEPCDRRFSNSYNLKVHIDIKHKKTETLSM